MPILLALLLLTSLALPGCRTGPRAPDRPERRVTLLYTGDLHGVTEPCGCTVDVMLGGIDRLGRRIALARADAGGNDVLVDAGNLLASASPIPLERRAQEEARSEVLADAFKTFSYDAVAVGPLDFAFGLEGLRKAAARGGIPWVASNLEVRGGSEPPWKPWRMVSAGDLRVAVLSIVDPDLMAGTDEVQVLAMDEALRKTLADIAPHKPDLVVGVGAVDRRKLRRLLKSVEGVDIFIRSHETAGADTPRPAGRAWIAEPHEEAQSLGRMRIALPGGKSDGLRPAGLSTSERERLERRRAHLARANRVDALREVEESLAKPSMADVPSPSPGTFSAELLAVTPDLAPIPELTALRTAFNKRLKEINLANAIPPPPLQAGAAGYAGVEECAMCHDEQEAFWKTTQHAHAVLTLVDRDKQFDEECIACHVTGYRKPGGSSLGHLGVLENVQCEACHGPSSLHADDGEKGSAPAAKVAEAICMTCHNAKHSPKFDYDVWKAKILGPGHGG